MVANGFEDYPWSIHGKQSSAAVGRSLAYAASPPGVIRPTDLRVYASGTPDGFVHVGVGAISIPNRYSSALPQNYVALANDVTDVAIPASGASIRRHLICVRVTDPAYGGQTPSDGKYVYPFVVSDVGPTVVRAEQVAALANVPAYAIARVDVPIGQSAIQQSYITELREIAQPRYYPYNKLAKFLSTEEDMLVSHTTYRNWPTVATAAVDIPSWCNWIDAEIELLGFKANGAGDVDTQVQLGTMAGTASRWDYNGANQTKVPGMVETFQHRSVLSAAVPTAMRGTQQTLRLQAVRVFTSNTGRVWTDQDGQASMRVEFFEKPAQS
jgi:hypothetical protein